MNALMPTEPELHAYVDGELDETRRGQIEALLPTHPEIAREIEQIRLASQRLRASLEPPPADTPARLDPFRIRRTLRDRTRQRMSIAASVMMALVVGGFGGWQSREYAMRQTYLPMADAVQAYRMFASNDIQPVSANAVANAGDDGMMVDIKASDPRELQAWLNHHFVQPETLPDFSAYGFKPVSGRLMSAQQGTAAMVLYRNAQGQSIVFYVRPPGDVLHFDNGNRKDGNLLAQYWRQGRYFYAVVSPTDTPATRPVQQAVEPTRS
ncbi:MULTISPECIES: anti-sigma factor family protein [Cupriavidus]|uniref:Anti-sigma factor n=1 Tax=Cupriavidus pauculus TaxID=82633 RepID=A0A5P2HCC7_9BURK|nr:anti-sigma factor [Cupriavidus pauculus]QET05821.1 anti-sigma factor [Cupriavidus pauculus]